MLVAHARQEKHYNRRRTEKVYNVGEAVLVYRPLRKKGRAEKLLFRYHGPFKIVKRINSLNYMIEPLYGSKKKRDCVHVSKLKRFIEKKPSVIGGAEQSVLCTCGEPAPKGVVGTPAGTGTTRQTEPREQSGVTAGSQPKLSTRTRVRFQEAHQPVTEVVGSKAMITTDEPSSTLVGGHRLRSRSHLRSMK
jgi:hypothetical protein